MSESDTRLIDAALRTVRTELIAATAAFEPFTSPREGWTMIMEELDEMWVEVKGNHLTHARRQAVRVAAMATRFLVDMAPILTAEGDLR